MEDLAVDIADDISCKLKGNDFLHECEQFMF